MAARKKMPRRRTKGLMNKNQRKQLDALERPTPPPVDGVERPGKKSWTFTGWPR